MSASICLDLWAHAHEDYRGELINLFVFCQRIIDVYCGQLTNESARFLSHSIYELSLVNVYGENPIVHCLPFELLRFDMQTWLKSYFVNYYHYLLFQKEMNSNNFLFTTFTDSSIECSEVWLLNCHGKFFFSAANPN